MKRLRLLRWSGSVLSPRTRPRSIQSPPHSAFRCQSSAAATVEPLSKKTPAAPASNPLCEESRLRLPSPPVQAARTSAKLSALHARLGLPSRLPLETLARTLVDSSADGSPRFNNQAFSILGNDLLAQYTSEYIICQ